VNQSDAKRKAGPIGGSTLLAPVLIDGLPEEVMFKQNLGSTGEAAGGTKGRQQGRGNGQWSGRKLHT
jgi:hypothetical protein